MAILPGISTVAGRALIALVALTTAQATRASDMQMVQFASLHPDGTLLSAALLRPEGDGPFPSVVLLHGCSGLYTSKGRMASREREWMTMLRADGYAVLAVDSFNPRGFRTICADKYRTITPEDDRPYDAYAALAWLRQQSFVQPDRIAIMGWSNGGTTTLATVSEKTVRSVGWREDGFAAAVAMYPGCLNLSRTSYTPLAPLLLEVGAKDDWTPATYCRQLVETARKNGGNAELDAYSNAHHGFDEPTGKLHTRMVSGGRLVHVGPEPQARALAITRVRTYLADALKR